MKLLLDKLMSANLTDTDEFTLLHFSAQFGRLEETKDFFTKGAALNSATNYMVLLHWLWLHKVTKCKPFIASNRQPLISDWCSFFPLRFVSSTIIRDTIYIDNWSWKLIAVILNVTWDTIAYTVFWMLPGVKFVLVTELNKWTVNNVRVFGFSTETGVYFIIWGQYI